MDPNVVEISPFELSRFQSPWIRQKVTEELANVGKTPRDLVDVSMRDKQLLTELQTYHFVVGNQALVSCTVLEGRYKS